MEEDLSQDNRTSRVVVQVTIEEHKAIKLWARLKKRRPISQAIRDLLEAAGALPAPQEDTRSTRKL